MPVQTQEVEVTFYESYDVGGGGMPIGHRWVQRAELKLPEGPLIIRHDLQARQLLDLVEARGQALAEPSPLTADPEYYRGNHNYTQRFVVSDPLSEEEINEQIPYKTVS
jgi:hypothetical protein